MSIDPKLIQSRIVLSVETEGSVRAVGVDGLVGQLSVNPADELGEFGVHGELFLLRPEELPLEVGVLGKVARPFIVRAIDPVLGPCDAPGSNLTDPEVVVMGIGFDSIVQSLVPGIALTLRVHHDSVLAPSVSAAWSAVRTATEVFGAAWNRAGLLDSPSASEGDSPREIAENRQYRCIDR